MSEPPIPEEPVIVTGWVDAVAAAEAGAIAYTDEQVPIVAGRMVPRNMDRAPLVEDGADLLDGTGWNQYDPVTGDLVQMWRWDGTTWQALDMSAEMIPVLDIGSATIGDLTGGRINVTEGPIVAGAPGGARVEITGDGLHAYDATGTETATIQGGEGVFVGGEFRTSDALPGQVTLSDDAYVHWDGTTHSGLRIAAANLASGEIPAGIAPLTGGGAVFNAGTNSDGHRGHILLQPETIQMHSVDESSGKSVFISTTPESASIRAGSGSVFVGAGRARSAYYDSPGNEGHVESDSFHGEVSFTRDGVTRALEVDSDGVWVKTTKSGVQESWNLELTANDSGWLNLPLNSAVTPSGNPAYRIKGNVVYFRGTLTLPGATWASGWTTLAAITDSGHKPSFDIQRAGASQVIAGIALQVNTVGTFEMYLPQSVPGSTTIQLSPMFYPIG